MGPFTVADYGWENDDVFMIIALPDSGMPVFDAPDLLVDKQNRQADRDIRHARTRSCSRSCAYRQPARIAF